MSDRLREWDFVPNPGHWTNGIALRSECAWCGREIGAYVPHLVLSPDRVCATCARDSTCPPETLAQLTEAEAHEPLPHD